MAKCNHCEYEWEYSGKLDRATCPNCGGKTRVEDND
jgi:DNA-directed RNA polymerase subunit RPC12/RpoP